MLESFLVAGRQDLTARLPSCATGSRSPTGASRGRRPSRCWRGWRQPSATATPPGRRPRHAERMRIAVLGVGLIGGSIGLAARARAEAEVCGYDPDPRREGAGRSSWARSTAPPRASPRPSRGADAVFAAAPVGALPAVVAEAPGRGARDCVVSDVGSTKRLLADASADARFVGGHPLAGAETEGVEHAREDLFDGATWYLTPARGSTAGVLYERLHALLRRLGARPAAIDAETHDRLMACVSHLPHVLANLLAAQAAGTARTPRRGRRAAARRGAELPRRDPRRRGQQRDLDRHLPVERRRARRRDRRARGPPAARCARCCAGGEAGGASATGSRAPARTATRCSARA